MKKVPLILAFETTLQGMSISLMSKDELIANFISSGQISASHELLIAADSLLRENRFEAKDLDALAVCAGPGSFTGIRVGLATVKGLAYGLRCNAFGISILEALALMACAEQNVCKKIIAAVYAGKNQIFTQTFSKGETETVNYQGKTVLIETANFIRNLNETKNDHLIIAEKKCAAELKYLEPALQLQVASDNVSDYIALRAAQLYSENGEPDIISKQDGGKYSLEPIYIRNFRVGG